MGARFYSLSAVLSSNVVSSEHRAIAVMSTFIRAIIYNLNSAVGFATEYVHASLSCICEKNYDLRIIRCVLPHILEGSLFVRP